MGESFDFTFGNITEDDLADGEEIANTLKERSSPPAKEPVIIQAEPAPTPQPAAESPVEDPLPAGVYQMRHVNGHWHFAFEGERAMIPDTECEVMRGLA